MKNNTNGFEYVFYQNLPNERQMVYKKYCYQFVSNLKRQYPNFDEWYSGLFDVWGLLKQNREFILCLYGNEIAGIAILKKEKTEKKICTLRVAKRFQRMSIGRNLMLLSFSWLDTDKPLITVQGRKQVEFQPLFRYFGFQLEDKKWNYYKLFSEELAYNGILPQRKTVYNSLERIREKSIKNYTNLSDCIEII